MKLRAVLFDRDNTIASTDETVYQEAALWIGARFGLDPRQAGRVLAGLRDLPHAGRPAPNRLPP